MALLSLSPSALSVAAIVDHIPISAISFFLFATKHKNFRFL